jgi:hypothetical protein
MFWTKLCLSQNSYNEAFIPRTQNVTVFGEVVKICSYEQTLIQYDLCHFQKKTFGYRQQRR